MADNFQSCLSVYKSVLEATHTHYGAFSGCYKIPAEDIPKVHKYIEEQAKKKVYFSLVEKAPCNGIKPFMIDLDLKYDAPEGAADTLDDVKQFCIIFMETIINNCDFSGDKIEMYIQSREGYMDKNKFKNGFHIVVPSVICDTTTQKYIRQMIVNSDEWTFEKNLNAKNDIFDFAVIEKNGFFVYGCGKAGKSPYKVSHKLIYDSGNNEVEFFEFEMDFTRKNIKLLQQQGYTNKDITIVFKSGIDLPEIEEQTQQQKIKVKLQKAATTKTEARVKQMTEPEAAEYIYLLHNINKSRFDDYHTWVKIAMLCKSSGIDFFWFNKFSKQSEKYPGELELQSFWNTLNIKDTEKPITIGTLYLWLKEDNEYEFNTIREKVSDVLLLQNHNKFAALFVHLIKDNERIAKNYYYLPEEEKWFYLSENKWYRTKSKCPPDSLKATIISVCESLLTREADLNHGYKKDVDDKIFALKMSSQDKKSIRSQLTELEEEYNEYEKRINNAVSCKRKIGQSRESEQMIDFIRISFTNHDMSIASFNLPHLFACENKVFDMTFDGEKIVGWRPIVPLDMVMHTTRYNYSDEENMDCQNKIYDFFYSLFPRKEDAEFVLYKFARALNGSLEGAQFFNIYTGQGRNGKSLLFSFIARVFGNYYDTIKSTFLTAPSKNADDASPTGAKLQGKRMVVASEPKENAFLNTEVIKTFTGNDIQKARNLYDGNQIDYKAQAHLALLCNNMPHYEDSSSAMAKRLNVVQFENTFVASPEEIVDEFTKLQDNTLDKTFSDPKYILAFLHILTKIYTKEFSSNLTLQKFPISVIQNTSKYNMDNDPIGQWLFNNYEFNEKADKIKGTILHQEFMDMTRLKKSATTFYSALKKHKVVIEESRKIGNHICGISKINTDLPDFITSKSE